MFNESPLATRIVTSVQCAAACRCAESEQHSDDCRYCRFRWNARLGREPNRGRNDSDRDAENRGDAHEKPMTIHERVSVWDHRSTTAKPTCPAEFRRPRLFPPDVRHYLLRPPFSLSRVAANRS